MVSIVLVYWLKFELKKNQIKTLTIYLLIGIFIFSNPQIIF